MKETIYPYVIYTIISLLNFSFIVPFPTFNSYFFFRKSKFLDPAWWSLLRKRGHQRFVPSIGKICEFATVWADWPFLEVLLKISAILSKYLTFEVVSFSCHHWQKKKSKLEILHIVASTRENLINTKSGKIVNFCLKMYFFRCE